MRLLHTADWHLGRSLCGFSLLEEQAAMLEQVVEIARREQPDAVLVAGDVYDRAVPPRQAVDLLDEVLSELVLGLEVQVILIAGNHDGPERLEFGHRLLAREGLHVFGEPTVEPQPLAVAGEGSTVLIHAVPYAEPPVVRHRLDREDLRTHQDALQALLENARAAQRERLPTVVVAHAFVTGGQASESERPLTVGTVETVAESLFDGFDYVALGHLHHPQNVGEGARIRYAGSLYPYSFSEAERAKSVTLVELDEAGPVRLQEIPLQPRRQVRVVRGHFDDLLKAEPSEDLLRIELLDERALFEPFARLRERFPYLLELRRPAAEAERVASGAAVDHRGRDDLDLFGDFFQEAMGAALTEEQQEVLRETLEELHLEEREVTP